MSARTSMAMAQSGGASPFLPLITHRWSTDNWTVSGSDVLVLPDSVAGDDANVVSATRPQVSNINGRDAALFQGASNYIQTPIIALESYTQLSVLWVWNGASVAATQNHWAAQKASAAPAATLVSFSLAANQVQVSVNSSVNIGYATSGTVNQVLLFTYDAVPAAGSRRWSWWRYQAGVATKGNGGSDKSADLPAVNLWSLGNRPSGSDPNGSRAALGELQTGAKFVEDALAPALLKAVASLWGI